MSNEVKVRFTGDDANLKKTAADVKRAVKGVADEAKKQKSAVDLLRSSWGKLTGAMAAIGTAYASMRVVRQSIEDASDLGETISKVGELFKDSSAQIEAWSMSSAKSFGQSRQQAMAAASDFAIFGGAAGLADRDLVNFSTTLTELASDLASFNNTSVDDAIVAIGAALRGESEPMRRYGVLLNDATLKAEAMRQGLIKTTTQALTPQQKVLAAYQVILQQTASAQGDFGRTSGGLANQSKTLEAQLKDLSAAVGRKLLPAATETATYLNTTAIPALKGAAEYAKELADQAERAAAAMNIPTPPKGTTDALVGIINPLSQAAALMEFLAIKGREVEQAAKDTADAATDGANKVTASIADMDLPIVRTLEAMDDLLGGISETLDLYSEQGDMIGNNLDLMKVQLALQDESVKSEQLATEAARKVANEKQKQLELELAIAEARASGNESELKRLEWIREYAKHLKEAQDAEMEDPHGFARRMTNAESYEPPSTSGSGGYSSSTSSSSERKPVVAGPPSDSGGATLKEGAALENFDRDTDNYYPAGHPRAGQMKTEALSKRRYLERRNTYALQTEARRRARGGGGSTVSNPRTPADIQADVNFGRLSPEEERKQRAEYEAMKRGESIEMDRQTMEASTSTSPGVTRDSDLAAMRAAVERIEKHVAKIEPKIPEGTT